MRISELDDTEKEVLLGAVVKRVRADLNDGRPLTEMRESSGNDSRRCFKCGHEERLSDNEGGTCEARIVLEQAELGVETTECGCFCQFAVPVCVQCESNARYNEAGGYHELAEKCREYCRRGHKEAEQHEGSVLGGPIGDPHGEAIQSNKTR